MFSGVRRCSISLLIAVSTLVGCAQLPRSGPDDAAIIDGAVASLVAPESRVVATDYALVDLTEEVLTHFPLALPPSLSRGFGATRRGAPTLPIGIGDVLQISIFESSEGGLFIPADAGARSGNFITLPSQTVSSSGTISVPYAGTIRVAGRTATDVQSEIESRIASRAIEPQAIINLVERRSSQVSVLGDVNSARKIEINSSGERILDVLSSAGGISAPGSETIITLQRNRTTASVLFNTLLDDPKENIFVYPGDVVYANRERRTYLAFGASGLNGRIDFEESDLTLAEAVAKAGGLLDNRADPAMVFLYRLVDREVLAAMGLQISAKSGSVFPVIFRVNLRDPGTYFLAQGFPMEDKDIIYISNANSVETVKLLGIINSVSSGVAGPPNDALSVRNSVRGFSE